MPTSVAADARTLMRNVLIHRTAALVLDLAARSKAARNCRALVGLVQSSSFARDEVPSIDDLRNLLTAVIGDVDAPEEDRKRAKAALAALEDDAFEGDDAKKDEGKDGKKSPKKDEEKDDKKAAASASAARLTAGERELLKRTSPRAEGPGRASARGSALQMPRECTPDQARARLAEMEKAGQ